MISITPNDDLPSEAMLLGAQWRFSSLVRSRDSHPREWFVEFRQIDVVRDVRDLRSVSVAGSLTKLRAGMQVVDGSDVASGWQQTSSVIRIGLSAEPPIGLHYLSEVRSMFERIGSQTMRLVEVDQCADLWLISGTANWAEGYVRKSRAVGDATPIVALDISRENGANVRILDAGADDCLACPFDPVELRARIQAVMRRQGSGLLCCPEIATDSDTLRIRVRDVEARVSRKQFEIFMCLAQRRGHWVHTDEIIAIVSGAHHDRQTSLVRVQIHALRKALGAERECIRSDGRKSYMLALETD